MSYFKYSNENKHNLRLSLVYLIASNVIRDRQTNLNQELTTLGILKKLKMVASHKEDYEVLEMIKDILKNKEYQIYEL